MNVLLLGFGLSNKAVYQYFKDKNVTIKIIEKCNLKAARNVIKENVYYDYLFKSPGIKFNDLNYLTIKNYAYKVTNEVDYAISLLKNKKIISITGSDGKTSLASLINHVLSIDKSTFIGGNIGNTLLDKIETIKDKEYFILELSSFQIETSSHMSTLGIIKNLHPNHLDTYINKELYYSYKLRLATLCKNIILNNKLKHKFINQVNYNIYKEGRKIFDNDEPIFDLSIIKDRDPSFEENIIFTLKTLKYFNLNYKHIEEKFINFKRVKYRLENLGNYLNTVFINDGKSSTSKASFYAYKAFKGHKILILGGIHKSSKFQFKINENDEVYIYGRDAYKIKNELKHGKIYNKLSDILKLITFNKKQTIIYSPGCSSFDQYKNYLERSKEFEMWANKWIK